MHVCKEKEYFLSRICDYETKESHKGKSLKEHCGEVLENFDKLYKFYGFTDDILLEAGHFLAYYHDIGKLNAGWDLHQEKKPPHAPKSLEFLHKFNVKFSTKPQLTPLLWYLISKHHGKLRLPEKEINEGVGEVFKLLEVERYWKILRDVNLVGLGDIFGLFKIADALSALAAESKNSAKKIEKLMVKEPKYEEKLIGQMIEKDFSEERWEKQLRIRDLPEVGLLRAPTGWGKTTVSLLFPMNKPCRRIFYLFPTITAINKFYEKMRKCFGEDVSKYFYFYDTEVKEDEEKLCTIFFTQNFLTPIAITTVDQFLLSFLQCGRYNPKRISFRNSAIIVDEVHLLNPLMLYLLSYFFKKYRRDYKIKLLLMSATLPKAYRMYFNREFNLSKDAFLDFGEEYAKKKRVLFDLSCKDISTHVQSIYQDYRENRRKVLVVVNTVEKAIDIGRKLREDFCEENEKSDIIIFHSRFMYCHRKDKENQLEEKKGKPHILVATQVCEISLDISYDVLYTEAAPLASIIQRFGRVNRYGKVVVKEVNAHVFFPKELLDPEGARHYPYEQWEVEKCWEVLRELEANALKNEKQLIERFDEIMSFQKLEEELKRSSEKMNIEFWESHLRMFFSLDVGEEELKNLIGYRDLFTTLVIPSQEVIIDEKIRQMVENLSVQIKKSEDLSFLQRAKLFAHAKELSVPVPIWWLKKDYSGIFPTTYLEGKKYNAVYGMFRENSSII